MTIKEHNGRCIGRSGIFEQWRDNTTGETLLFAVFPIVNGRMTNPVTEVTYDEQGNKTEWEAFYQLPPFWEEQVEIGATAAAASTMEPERQYWWTPEKVWLLALIMTVDALLFLLWWLRP